MIESVIQFVQELIQRAEISTIIKTERGVMVEIETLKTILQGLENNRHAEKPGQHLLQVVRQLLIPALETTYYRLGALDSNAEDFDLSTQTTLRAQRAAIQPVVNYILVLLEGEV